jgi:prepilin-type N-terminal cleavage/methylation domain-containing protein
VKNLRQNIRGFSLIEVLLATIILGTALVALSSSWSGTMFSFKKSEKIQIITSLLKSKTTELELKYAQLSFSAIPETEDGDFGDEFPELSWKSEVRDMEFPDMTSIMAGKDGIDETTRSIVKQMTDHFSKNIKEIRITIFWKAKKGKPVQYSSTTYIVNYTTGLPPAGG